MTDDMNQTVGDREAPMQTAVETVVCRECGQNVAPTRDGGTRPRDHNDTKGVPCTGPRQGYTLPPCDRCGFGAHDPEGCSSALYHPETWTENVRGKRIEVGNAAAAGEIVKVAGEQYQWLVRVPPKGPRQAPAHLGIRRDGVRYYSMDEVRDFVKSRPGPGGHGPASV